MRTLLRLALATVAFIPLLGCAVFATLPAPASTEQRLEMIPKDGAAVERPVTIYWSKEQIPFVVAETDRDAAFALGLVHAHLRLGQLEVMRRVSQGRLMEIAGPAGRVRQIEQALRILDLGKTSKEVYAQMPAESKAFLKAFVEGLNHYQHNVAVLPHEYRLLGMTREPWSPDELLTIGRLASVDVSWLVWFRLLPLRGRPDWPDLWAEALRRGTATAPSGSPEQNAALHELTEILAATPRVGSNSFAVGSAKTRSGSAIIASDPHLGFSLPNIWLIAGLQSPSYHAVGLMIPGLPFIAVGRNETIAWGGTNMRSAASDLFDISNVPPEQIVTREVTAKVRWWPDETFQIRESPYGPVISDAAAIPKRDGEMFSLKWIGHRPSDEISAMLAANRARNWEEFRAGLEPFAISAQNFIYADSSGHVGQLTTTHLPRRSAELPADIVRPLSHADVWNTILTSRDLPQFFDPPQGFVASANNKPAETPYPIGYFYSGSDRVLRMRDILSSAADVTVDDIKALQRDTYMISSARLRDALVARARQVADISTAAQEALEVIASWDGRYEIDSKGAVAFQAAVATLVPSLVSDIDRTIIETGGSEGNAYAQLVDAANPGALDDPLKAALAAASEALATYPTWGDMHTLVLRHTFGVLPLVGGRYRYGELPWPGSSDTLWRADHGLSAGKVTTGFGSQARHISDMSDLDSNWFVLLGGNDGWLNSANFTDEVDVFRSGELIQVPLRIETVQRNFPYRTELIP